MLSDDEMRNGMPFILQLRNAAGVAFQWIELLRGKVAKRWYEIYRASDWEALRSEAAAVFHNSVTETQMQDVLKTGKRCIFINEPPVKTEELRNLPA